MSDYIKLITDLSEILSDKLDTEINTSLMSNSPTKALESKQWVLDTNSIYRQKPDEDYTSIVNFILTNPVLYDRELLVPWNVICEINRHKDSNKSSNVNASKQGLENLKMLNLLDNIGFLSFKIEEVPNKIDNSIRKNTGVTDMSIVNSVPEEGVLFTNDEHLIEISEMMGVSTDRIENVSGFSESKNEEDYWAPIKEELNKTGPRDYQEVSDQLENLLSDSDNEHQISAEAIINKKLRSGELIHTPTNVHNIRIALAKEISIIPTFNLINKINRTLVEIDGDNFIPEEVLENIRRSIGGMNTSRRPKLKFIIPAEYVYRSSEISQVDDLEVLRYIDNAGFETVHPHSSVENETSIENVIIKSAIEQDCPVLCTDEEEMRKFRLLELSHHSVRIE